MYLVVVILVLTWPLTMAASIKTNNALYRCGMQRRFGTPLIQHGRIADLGQWPWHGALHHRTDTGKEEYQCGGTLIDQRHVLTAAHCVSRGQQGPMSASKVTVHFGVHNLFEFADQVQKVNVSRIYQHPEFAPKQHDVAVLELASAVRFSDYVIPICLEKVQGGGTDDLIGLRGWTAGWGLTERGSIARRLRTIQMPVVNNTECVMNDRQLFGTFISPAIYCAGDKNGTNVCRGDSGGGMYFYSHNRWQLRGMVSFAKMSSKGNCDTITYAGFTNVAYYYAWIKKITDGIVDTSSSSMKRISELKCEEFANSTETKSSGRVCLNSRSPQTVFVAGEHSCNGVLVSELFVLTVSKCHGSITNDTKVVINSWITRSVIRFVRPPNLTAGQMDGSIMLVEMKSKLLLTRRLIPACLPTSIVENVYDELLFNGYSRFTAQYMETSNNRAIPLDECKKFNNVTEAALCVVTEYSDFFDWLQSFLLPGAALQTLDDRKCAFTVLGLYQYSGSTGGTLKNMASTNVFVRILPHLHWIEQVVWIDAAARYNESTPIYPFSQK